MFTATVAVDAGAIDIEWAGDVFWTAVGWVGHGRMSLLMLFEEQHDHARAGVLREMQ
jgi:hypothetical protein